MRPAELFVGPVTKGRTVVLYKKRMLTNIHTNEPSGKFKNQIVDAEYVVPLLGVYSGGRSYRFGVLTLIQQFWGQRISPSVGQSRDSCVIAVIYVMMVVAPASERLLYKQKRSMR